MEFWLHAWFEKERKTNQNTQIPEAITDMQSTCPSLDVWQIWKFSKNRKRSVPISGLKINADLDLALVELSIPVKEMKNFLSELWLFNYFETSIVDWTLSHSAAERAVTKSLIFEFLFAKSYWLIKDALLHQKCSFKTLLIPPPLLFWKFRLQVFWCVTSVKNRQNSAKVCGNYDIYTLKFRQLFP